MFLKLLLCLLFLFSPAQGVLLPPKGHVGETASSTSPLTENLVSCGSSFCSPEYCKTVVNSDGQRIRNCEKH
ncbi:unnamed protein product [Caenorhabditis auriculariae]|uniref:Uncharacterized protein n=1 Tax=Caenorhabditis auriculariae TaxID=2777116 RepID=A0A8S1GYU5_9PELO|nr:unnamed protein product [Caenorhabditis auriculariae]